jgi:ABC-type transporter Mla MlaB component
MQLPETVTLVNARAVRDQVVSELNTHPQSGNTPLTVDASGLKKFDSGLLTVLLELQRRAKARGIAVTVRGIAADVRERIQKLADAYGMWPLVQPLLAS